MEDVAPNAMNLDLNLSPNDSSSNDSDPEVGLSANEDINLEDWLDGPGPGRRIIRQRRRRWSLWRQFPDSPDASNRNLSLRLNDGVSLHVGEGSIAAEEMPSNGTKTCDNNDVFLDDALGKKDNEENGSADTGSFFDCNICLDMANDPVVTCCGHLFCWPCLYKWLHLHSDAKECPFCKGEVNLKNVTPIYGRGESVVQPVNDINLKIPRRPQARRVESSRQVIQRFDLSQVQPQPQPQPQLQHIDAPRESPERSMLNGFRSSRIRRGRISAIPYENVLDDLTPSRPARPSVYFRRSHAGLAATLAHQIESYLPNDTTLERNQEQPQAVDDRDSVSSIAAVIQSDTQTVDTTFEMDSRHSISTSSSRRRNNASRVSDVDSGDSLRLRRRRLN